MRVFYDLTRPMVPGMPVYPGDPAINFAPAATLESDGFRVTEVRFSTHSGTHLDAPSHFLAEGGGIDAISLSKLIGPARVIGHTTTMSPFEIQPGERLLIRSGWSNHWKRPDYFEAFPPLPAPFIQAVAAAPAALIGIETPSLHPDHAIDAEFHRRLLGAGVIIVENLVGLRELPDYVDVAVLPLPLEGLDGSPCRAVAWAGQ